MIHLLHVVPTFFLPHNDMFTFHCKLLLDWMDILINQYDMPPNAPMGMITMRACIDDILNLFGTLFAAFACDSFSVVTIEGISTVRRR